MATYQSVSSAGPITSGDAITISKPTGLAVGDVMVAGIYDREQGPSVTPPAGWTSSVSTGAGSGGRSIVLSVFTKTADASDVSASNFTFTISNSTSANNTLGIIARLSAPGINAGSTSNALETSGNTVTATGFTPTRSNCLFLLFAAGGTDSNVTQAVSTVAMASNNPTWTSRATVSQNTANDDDTLVLYTATRPEATATGTFTVTMTNSGVQTLATVILAISPQVNGSITQETKVNAYAFSPIPETQVDAIVDDPTLTEGRYTAWTNETKPSTTWTNET